MRKIDGLLNSDIYPLAAFFPFVPLALKAFYNLMPLKWVFLFTVLQAATLCSFFLNFIRNDFFWCLLALCSYTLVSIPVYTKMAKKPPLEQDCSQELFFRNIFRRCSREVFSDYRVSLLSKIPLAVQMLAGGSFLYGIFGVDWMLHALAGFGVGALSFKAYTTSVNYYGYPKLAAYFGLSRFRVFKFERSTGSLEFTFFSIVVVAVLWEVMERSVNFVSPDNIFRVGGETPLDIFGDILFGIVGALIAWYIFTHKVIPLQPVQRSLEVKTQTEAS